MDMIAQLVIKEEEINTKGKMVTKEKMNKVKRCQSDIEDDI